MWQIWEQTQTFWFHLLLRLRHKYLFRTILQLYRAMILVVHIRLLEYTTIGRNRLATFLLLS
jgi:hypothetical protein